MSEGRVLKTIGVLSTVRQLSEDDLHDLRRAAGRSVSDIEFGHIDEFIRSRPELLPFDLEPLFLELFERPLPPASQFEFFEAEEIAGVKEPSAIQDLGEGRFLIVDDEAGLFFMSPTGVQMLLSSKDFPVLFNLEGLAVEVDPDDPHRWNVWMVAEDKNRISTTTVLLDGDGKVTAEEPSELGELSGLSDDGKGYEGIALVPGQFFMDGRTRLLAVHESQPRRISFFDPATLELECSYRVPQVMDAYLLDLSDVAVDADSRRVYLVSDRSCAMVELEFVEAHSAGSFGRLDASQLRPLGFVDLRPYFPREAKVEGISVRKDQFHIVAEGEPPMLLPFRRRKTP